MALFCHHVSWDLRILNPVICFVLKVTSLIFRFSISEGLADIYYLPLHGSSYLCGQDSISKIRHALGCPRGLSVCKVTCLNEIAEADPQYMMDFLP